MNAAAQVTPATAYQLYLVNVCGHSLFTVDGVRHELVTHKTGRGRVEVYCEYADGCGLMQWRGYYDQVCVSDRKLSERVHAALAVHNAAHRNFWNAYLPGASTWLAAA